jgi:hypothetical protein
VQLAAQLGAAAGRASDSTKVRFALSKLTNYYESNENTKTRK